MYSKSLIIVIGYLLAYLLLNEENTSSIVYYTEAAFLLGGYFYCLATSLYKMKRTSPVHEFQDEEERQIILTKSD